MRLVTPEEEYQLTKLTLTFSRARATVQDRRWLRRLKRREEPQTDKTEHPALALRGWVKRFGTFSIFGCLSFSILLSFYPFLMCPYPIRWFPVPSVIAPSPRSPILSGICQCTRRLGFGCIFSFLVQDDGETVLLRRLWMEVPSPPQHAKALGHPQDPGQGATHQKTNHFPPDFSLTPLSLWALCRISKSLPR